MNGWVGKGGKGGLGCKAGELGWYGWLGGNKKVYSLQSHNFLQINPSPLLI